MYDDKDNKKKKDHGDSGLFGQSGPISLGGDSGGSMLDKAKPPTPYTPSAPYQPAETYTPEITYSTTPSAPPPEVKSEPVTEYTESATQPTSYSKPSAPPPSPPPQAPMPEKPVMPKTNASVSWSPTPWSPRIDASAFVHPNAMVYGNVLAETRVFIAAGAMIRGENDEPIHIGMESNIQEGVVLKELVSRRDGAPISQRIVDVGSNKYSLYIGKRVSIASQAQIHGPAYIGDEVYVGMQALVFWARIEKGVILEPGSLVMNVTVPAGRFVPAGLKVTTQKMVADLPPLTSKYRFYGINNETVEASLEMLRGYKSLLE